MIYSTGISAVKGMFDATFMQINIVPVLFFFNLLDNNKSS